MFGYMAWDKAPPGYLDSLYGTTEQQRESVENKRRLEQKLLAARDKAEKILTYQFCEDFVKTLISIIQPALGFNDEEKSTLVAIMCDLAIDFLQNKNEFFSFFDMLNHLSKSCNNTPRLLDIINYILINIDHIRPLIDKFHADIKNIVKRDDFLLFSGPQFFLLKDTSISNQLARDIVHYEDEEEQARELIVTQESTNRAMLVSLIPSI